MRLRMGNVRLSGAVPRASSLIRQPPALHDLRRQRVVLRRIHLVQPTAEHGPRHALRRQRAEMRRGVDPARETGDHRHARVGNLVAELLRRLQAVMARLARADDSHAARATSRNRALDIEHQRRVIDFAQARRILLVGLRDDLQPQFRCPLALLVRISRLLPRRDLLDHLVTDSSTPRKSVPRAVIALSASQTAPSAAPP